jgi:hypothetical protein
MGKLAAYAANKWLRTEGLIDGEKTFQNVKIVGAREDTLTDNQGTETLKAILKFEEYDAELALNKTNTTALMKLFGNDIDMDDLLGQTVCLFVVDTEMGPGIRIRGKMPAGATSESAGEAFVEE